MCTHTPDAYSLTQRDTSHRCSVTTAQVHHTTNTTTNTYLLAQRQQWLTTTSTTITTTTYPTTRRQLHYDNLDDVFNYKTTTTHFVRHHDTYDYAFNQDVYHQLHGEITQQRPTSTISFATTAPLQILYGKNNFFCKASSTHTTHGRLPSATRRNYSTTNHIDNHDNYY